MDFYPVGMYPHPPDKERSAKLEPLLREAEAEVLKKTEQAFADAVAEHERQTAGYRFECRRWGDFLSVFIERAANAETEWGWEYPKRLSHALNIGSTRSIEMVDGRCFDRLGSVYYLASGSHKKVDGKTVFGESVTAMAPNIPTSRPLLDLDKKESVGRFPGNRLRYETEGYPRPAKDDEIRFIGINATIYAPAGLGRGVYDTIMAEIATVDLPKLPL